MGVKPGACCAILLLVILYDMSRKRVCVNQYSRCACRCHNNASFQNLTWLLFFVCFFLNSIQHFRNKSLFLKWMHAEHIPLKDPRLVIFQYDKIKTFPIPKSVRQQNCGQNCVVNLAEIVWEPSVCTCTKLLINETLPSCSSHALSLPRLSLFNLVLFNSAQYQWNWVEHWLYSLNSFTTVLNRWRNRITILRWG